jgi:hypothetical protein
MLKIFKSSIVFDKKKRAVIAGYRPTLLVGIEKALCNIDDVFPTPLSPAQKGTATIRIWWDPSYKGKIDIGQKFELLEGEKSVGSGTIVEVLS